MSPLVGLWYAISTVQLNLVPESARGGMRLSRMSRQKFVIIYSGQPFVVLPGSSAPGVLRIFAGAQSREVTLMDEQRWNALFERG